MKYIFSFISTILFSFCCLASNIHYKISYPHGLFKFALTMAGSSNESKTLYQIASDKKFFDILTPKDVEDLQLVLTFLSKSYSSEYGNTKGISLEEIYTIRSIQSVDLADFKERTLGLLPLNIENNFFKLLLKIEPFYKKEIWNHSLNSLLNIKKAFDAYHEEIGFDEIFKSLKVFYQSNWPDDQEFTVGLYPIPAKEGHSTARSLGIVESVGVLTEKNSNEDVFGVVIHEMAHSLYREQRPVISEKWNNWVNSSKDMSSKNILSTNLNEVLATIIGNGYIYQRIVKKLDSSSWYNDDAINDIAKLLYEDTLEYLMQSKPLDETYFTHAISKINKELPTLASLYSEHLKNIVLVSNLNDTVFESKNLLKNNFIIHSIYGYTGINKEFNKSFKLNLKEKHTPVLIFNNKKEFKKISNYLNKKEVSELNKFIKSDSSNAVLSAHGKTPYILIYAKDLKELESVIKDLKSKKYITI